MAKRSRVVTRRRRLLPPLGARYGGAWYNPFSWGQGAEAEAEAPPPVGTAPAGELPAAGADGVTGGRRKRRGSTRRRRSGRRSTRS